MSGKTKAFGRALQLALLSASILAIPIAFVGNKGLAEPKDIVFEEGFENGNFSPLWLRDKFCCAHTGVIVNSPVRSGSMAIRFENRKEDNEKHAGMRLPNEPAYSERWYGISFLVPEENIPDPAGELYIQWHDRPDWKLGETWRNPPLALSIVNDKISITSKWDSKPVTVAPQYEGSKAWDIGSVQKGVWEDFVFHVKWSYQSNGFIEVWRNGTKVIQYAGPIGYNDQAGPFVWIGMYKYHGTSPFAGSNSTKRVVYIDEFRIGNEKATYNDVVPRGVFSR
jgi:hypothetical protein